MPEHTWTTGYAAMPIPTGDSHIAGPLGGLIYTAGGVKPPGGGTPSADVYAYDPAADTWAVKTSMPAARFGSVVTAIANGKLYVIGGRNDSFVDTATVYEYTPGTNTWATKTASPRTSGQTVVATGDAVGTTIYVTYNSAGFPQESYDTLTDTWTAKTGGGPGGYSAALGGYLHQIGGGVHKRYDPAANAWTARANPGSTTFHGGVGVDSLGVLVMQRSSAPGGVASVLAYTSATDTWAVHATIPTDRGNQGTDRITVLVNNNYVYAIGGHIGGPNQRYQVGPDPVWYVGAVALART